MVCRPATSRVLPATSTVPLSELIKRAGNRVDDAVALAGAVAVAGAVVVGVAVVAGKVLIPTTGTISGALEPSGRTGTEGTALGSNPGVAVAMVGTVIVGAVVGTAIVGAVVGTAIVGAVVGTAIVGTVVEILLGNAAGTVGASVGGVTTGTVVSGGTTGVRVVSGGTTGVRVVSGGTVGTPGRVGRGSAVIVARTPEGTPGLTRGATVVIVGNTGIGIRVATTVGADATVWAIVVAALPANAVTVATTTAP